MATVKWSSLSTVVAALANADIQGIANNAYQLSLGAVINNSVDLNRWGWLELKLGSLSPLAGACVFIYLVPSFDGGVDYDDGPSATNPASHLIVANLSIGTGAAAKKATYGPIQLPAGHFKFGLRNSTGVALAATGNTLDLYTNNESVV